MASPTVMNTTRTGIGDSPFFVDFSTNETRWIQYWYNLLLMGLPTSMLRMQYRRHDLIEFHDRALIVAEARISVYAFLAGDVSDIRLS